MRSIMTLRTESQMLVGAKICLYCEISKSKMTPAKFEQFGHYRLARDKIFESWLRAFAII
jgi:hypothetical protein